MRLLIVVDQFDSGNNGTTISAQRFARALRERGHEVRVAAAGKPAEGKYALPRIHFLPLVDNIIKSQGMCFARPRRATLRAAMEWADVVHFMMPLPLEQVGRKMACQMNKPHTAAFHVQPENITSTLGLRRAKPVNEALYAWFRDSFYNHFTHVHCPSEFIAGQLRAHGYTARLHVISNGVDDCFYPRREEKQGPLAGKYVVLMIGRFSEEKRQEVLLQAVRESRHAKQIQLVLAGQGPREKHLRKLGERLPNPPIMGFYSTRQLCRLMAMTDLYVHTAVAEIEAIACLEAVASGLVPVIADSPLSATPQFALDGRSLFPADDAAALARKIDYWLENGAEREAMGRRYAESAARYRLASSAQKAEEMFQLAFALARGCRSAARHARAQLGVCLRARRGAGGVLARLPRAVWLSHHGGKAAGAEGAARRRGGGVQPCACAGLCDDEPCPAGKARVGAEPAGEFQYPGGRAPGAPSGRAGGACVARRLPPFIP